MGIERFFYNLATDKKKGLALAPLKFILTLLSFLYGGLVRFLIWFYALRPLCFSCKVISIGNITWGGTGKTTLAEFIASYLQRQGHRVAILSRGYCRRSNQSLGQGEKFLPDEPLMLKKRLPGVEVLIDPDRIRSGRRAIKEFGVDTLLLDDGFQQWRIKKDLEIVTIDCRYPLGNGYLIPRGILRQPISTLSRAHIFAITKTNLYPVALDLIKTLRKINTSALIIETAHEPLGFYQIGQEDGALLTPDSLKGERVGLFSGIGDPDSFERLVAKLGLEIGFYFSFPDHHNFSPRDIEDIVALARDKKITTLLTTQKDAMRLRGITLPLRTLVLCIRLKITKNEEEFYQRLHSLYRI